MNRAKWPRVRYAMAGSVSIAYEVRGDGPIDVVRVPGLMGSLIGGFLDPSITDVLERLSTFCRLTSLDRRGMGLSDPLHVGDAPPLEQQVSDIAAVMDAVGCQRASLWAAADAGPVALMFAAVHPDRVASLVLNNSWARTFRSDDYPCGRAVDPKILAKQIHEQWGDANDPWAFEVFGGDRIHERGFREVYAQVQQVSASRAAAAAAILNMDVDVRDLLPLVQAPTLILRSANAGHDVINEAQFLCDHLSGARVTTYRGQHSYAITFTNDDYDVIEEFLTGERPNPTSERVLASVLFTDIVASTQLAAQLGDREWRGRLDDHDEMVRSCLQSFSGREVKHTGDGFLAVFDGPASAVRCAHAIIQGASSLGIDVRSGVHVGECDIRGEDLSGLAVHIGSRVAALAGGGEVFTTRTVKDLVAGSGITFTDLGFQELKGVPEPWQILSTEISN